MMDDGRAVLGIAPAWFVFDSRAVAIDLNRDGTAKDFVDERNWIATESRWATVCKAVDDGSRLAYVSDGTVHVRVRSNRLADLKLAFLPDEESEWRKQHKFKMDFGWQITELIADRESNRLFAGDTSGLVKCWDLRTGKATAKFMFDLGEAGNASVCGARGLAAYTNPVGLEVADISEGTILFRSSLGPIGGLGGERWLELQRRSVGSGIGRWDQSVQGPLWRMRGDDRGLLGH